MHLFCIFILLYFPKNIEGATVIRFDGLFDSNKMRHENGKSPVNAEFEIKASEKKQKTNSQVIIKNSSKLFDEIQDDADIEYLSNYIRKAIYAKVGYTLNESEVKRIINKTTDHLKLNDRNTIRRRLDANLREKLNNQLNDLLLLRASEGHVELTTLTTAVKHTQTEFTEYKPMKISKEFNKGEKLKPIARFKKNNKRKKLKAILSSKKPNTSLKMINIEENRKPIARSKSKKNPEKTLSIPVQEYLNSQTKHSPKYKSALDVNYKKKSQQVVGNKNKRISSKKLEKKLRERLKSIISRDYKKKKMKIAQKIVKNTGNSISSEESQNKVRDVQKKNKNKKTEKVTQHKKRLPESISDSKETKSVVVDEDNSFSSSSSENIESGQNKHHLSIQIDKKDKNYGGHTTSSKNVKNKQENGDIVLHLQNAEYPSDKSSSYSNTYEEGGDSNSIDSGQSTETIDDDSRRNVYIESQVFTTVKSMYDTLRVVGNDTDIMTFISLVNMTTNNMLKEMKDQLKIEWIKKSINHIVKDYQKEFGVYTNNIKHHQIVTSLGKKRAMLNTLATNNLILNTLIQNLMDDDDIKRIRTDKGTSVYSKEEKTFFMVLEQKITELDKRYHSYACHLGMCRENKGFSQCLIDLLNEVLKSGNTRLKQLTDNYIEMIKTNTVMITDENMKTDIGNYLDTVEKMSINEIRISVQLLRNMVMHRDHNQPLPTEIITGQAFVAKSIAFFDIIDSLEEMIEMNDENKQGCKEINKEVRDWVANGQSDIKETMKKVMVFVFKKGYLKMDTETRNMFMQNLATLLNSNN